jgi:hypothetical protein
MFMERNRHKEFKELVRGQYMFYLDESTRYKAERLLREMLENDEEFSNSEYDALIEALTDQLVYEVLDGDVSSPWWDNAERALEILRNNEIKQGLSWVEILDKYLHWFELWDLLSNRDKQGVRRMYQLTRRKI